MQQKFKKGEVLALFQNSLAHFNVNSKSNRPEVFCKLGVLGNFAKFTGKHVRQSVFFNKVVGLRPETSFKGDFDAGIFH